MFKRGKAAGGDQRGASFNPSVGILGVQARACRRCRFVLSQFQSLGRDSGCSSDSGPRRSFLLRAVSIPRSGFWVFKPTSRGTIQRHRRQVSIPRSGFWVFKHHGTVQQCYGWLGFNPSVGILGVQASTFVAPASWEFWFQSLGRDSGCSSFYLGKQFGNFHAVSIPRSGFWVFKPIGVARDT